MATTKSKTVSLSRPFRFALLPKEKLFVQYKTVTVYRKFKEILKKNTTLHIDMKKKNNIGTVLP